nr:unnamed protein product [Callosobruchus chinensis]
MIRFKGRISFRQYMPMKPIKRGYKMWVRANESGFISQFQIHTCTGKEQNVIERNLGERVVCDLTRVLVGKHHEVYMDNFLILYCYNSVCRKTIFIVAVRPERIENGFLRIL